MSDWYTKHTKKDLAERIEQLEADLASAAKADPMTATSILLGREIGRLERELAAEKALADRLAEYHRDIAGMDAMGASAVAFNALIAYRKARGL